MVSNDTNKIKPQWYHIREIIGSLIGLLISIYLIFDMGLTQESILYFFIIPIVFSIPFLLKLKGSEIYMENDQIKIKSRFMTNTYNLNKFEDYTVKLQQTSSPVDMLVGVIAMILTLGERKIGDSKGFILSVNLLDNSSIFAKDKKISLIEYDPSSSQKVLDFLKEHFKPRREAAREATQQK